jgi:hypothetical protein
MQVQKTIQLTLQPIDTCRLVGHWQRKKAIERENESNITFLEMQPTASSAEVSDDELLDLSVLRDVFEAFTNTLALRNGLREFPPGNVQPLTHWTFEDSPGPAMPNRVDEGTMPMNWNCRVECSHAVSRRCFRFSPKCFRCQSCPELYLRRGQFGFLKKRVRLNLLCLFSWHREKPHRSTFLTRLPMHSLVSEVSQES